MKRVLTVALLAATTLALGAGLPASAKSEIDRLLAALGASSCEFYRNGSWYDAADAKAHLGKKYDYLLKKGMLDSTEDFIAKAATKSSTSGETYQVRGSGGPAEPSADWLRKELTRLRAAPAK